jgi:hypothetical protein
MGDTGVIRNSKRKNMVDCDLNSDQLRAALANGLQLSAASRERLALLTKHPKYIILRLDVPGTCDDMELCHYLSEKKYPTINTQTKLLPKQMFMEHCARRNEITSCDAKQTDGAKTSTPKKQKLFV